MTPILRWSVVPNGVRHSASVNVAANSASARAPCSSRCASTSACRLAAVDARGESIDAVVILFSSRSFTRPPRHRTANPPTATNHEPQPPTTNLFGGGLRVTRIVSGIDVVELYRTLPVEHDRRLFSRIGEMIHLRRHQRIPADLQHLVRRGA